MKLLMKDFCQARVEAVLAVEQMVKKLMYSVNQTSTLIRSMTILPTVMSGTNS